MTALRTPLQVTRMCFVAGTLVKAKQGLVKIEDVQAGMEVWSRDEVTMAEGWKPVAQTFITHPAELHHLTYELRGPPESGPPSPGAEFETLGVTAPHPFWVSSRSKPGFVPAGELVAGDELRLANGGRATVTANTRETAPFGETFTTYNFEVADFHTYFVGRSEVWVHNSGKGRCELILSIYKHFRTRASGAETPWDTLLQTRSAMVDDGFDLTKGVAVSGLYWRRTVKVMNDDIFAQVAGGGLSLLKLPSHKKIIGEFAGTGLGSNAPKRLNDFDTLESHHIVEQWLQDRLGLTGSMTGDDIPGFITTFAQHRASGMTPKSIASRLRELVGESRAHDDIVSALQQTYLEHGLNDVWGGDKKIPSVERRCSAMKIQTNFAVYEESRKALQSTSKSDAVLNISAFEELKDLVVSNDLGYIAGSPALRMLSLSFDESCDAAGKIFEIIEKDTGKVPSAFTSVGTRYTSKRSDIPTFCVLRRPAFSEPEIKQAKYLMVLASPELAYFDGLTNDGKIVIRADERLKNRRNYGALFPSGHLGVSEAVAKPLREREILGLRLEETKLHKPKLGAKVIHHLTSSVMLPRCELTLCDNQGDDILPTSNGCNFVAKTDPPILRYRNDSIVGLEFDIARTCEVIGGSPGIASPYLVISQRFRNILKELECDGASYQPIEIISG